MALPPLQVHFLLHKLRNWSLRELTDAAGNKCVHFCIPVEENGIELINKDASVITSIADVTAVAWNYMAVPSFKEDTKQMYGLVPVMSKRNWEAVKERGLVDPERKNFHFVCGNISPWPYAYTKKKKAKKA